MDKEKINPANPMEKLVAGLASIFGTSEGLAHALPLPEGVEVPGMSDGLEIQDAINYGAAFVVVLPHTESGQYFFDAAGNIVGSIMLPNEYPTFFAIPRSE